MAEPTLLIKNLLRQQLLFEPKFLGLEQLHAREAKKPGKIDAAFIFAWSDFVSVDRRLHQRWTLNHFFIAVWSKRSRIRPVKHWEATLTILTVLSASIVLADDFKTINGKEYKNATITRVEGDGIVLRTKTGISKVYFTELPQEVQEKFHYGQATPIAQREREPIKVEAKQDGRRQADGGGRVVVVGQSAVSLKVIIAGIVVLVVVVLAVVRSRS